MKALVIRGGNRHQLFHFVGLDMTYKVPIDISWKLWYLFYKFINVVFSKVSLSSLIGSQDVFNWLSL